MQQFQDLATKPQVSSVSSASVVLDNVFGKDGWELDVGFMSPAWHWVMLKVHEGPGIGVPVIRKAWALEGPDVAFLKAYAMLGGKAKLPEPTPPSVVQKIQRPQAAQPIKSALPAVAYNGPTPWGDDSNASVHPLMAPKPPQEPDWFGAKMGGFAKKRDMSFAEVTWGEAVRQELENPGGRDQPLGYVRWQIEKRDRPKDPKLQRPWENYISRGKAALIWWMQAKDQLAAQGDVQPSEEYEETPW